MTSFHNEAQFQLLGVAPSDEGIIFADQTDDDLSMQSPPDFEFFKHSPGTQRTDIDDDILFNDLTDDNLFKQSPPDYSLFKHSPGAQRTDIDEDILFDDLTGDDLFQQPPQNYELFKHSPATERTDIDDSSFDPQEIEESQDEVIEFDDEQEASEYAAWDNEGLFTYSESTSIRDYNCAAEDLIEALQLPDLNERFKVTVTTSDAPPIPSNPASRVFYSPESFSCEPEESYYTPAEELRMAEIRKVRSMQLLTCLIVAVFFACSVGVGTSYGRRKSAIHEFVGNESVGNEFIENEYVTCNVSAGTRYDTMIDLYIDGLIEPLEEKEQIILENAFMAAYNNVSGYCDDLYQRWMYKVTTYNQVVLGSGNSTQLITKFTAQISCSGCPKNESFASSYNNETRSASTGGTPSVNAVDVLLQTEENLKIAADKNEFDGNFSQLPQVKVLIDVDDNTQFRYVASAPPRDGNKSSKKSSSSSWKATGSPQISRTKRPKSGSLYRYRDEFG